MYSGLKEIIELLQPCMFSKELNFGNFDDLVGCWMNVTASFDIENAYQSNDEGKLIEFHSLLKLLSFVLSNRDYSNAVWQRARNFTFDRMCDSLINHLTKSNTVVFEQRRLQMEIRQQVTQNRQTNDTLQQQIVFVQSRKKIIDNLTKLNHDTISLLQVCV